MTTLASNIQTLRKYLGYSQADLANALGIPRTGFVQIERGARKVSTEELTKLAAIFHVTTDYLLGESKEEVDVPVNLIGQLNALNKTDLKAVFDFMEYLTERRKRKQERKAEQS